MTSSESELAVNDMAPIVATAGSVETNGAGGSFPGREVGCICGAVFVANACGTDGPADAPPVWEGFGWGCS